MNLTNEQWEIWNSIISAIETCKNVSVSTKNRMEVLLAIDKQLNKSCVSDMLPLDTQNEFSKRLKQFCDENELTSIPAMIAMPTIIKYLFENYNIDFIKDSLDILSTIIVSNPSNRKEIEPLIDRLEVLVTNM
jgi:hypothetical protein